MQPFPLIPLSFALLLSLEMWLTRKQNIKSVFQFPIYFVINYYHYNYYIVFSYKINFTWHEQYSWYHDKHLNFKERSFFNARIGEISLKLSGKKNVYFYKYYFYRSFESFTTVEKKSSNMFLSLAQLLLYSTVSIKFKGCLNRTILFITYLSDLSRQIRNNGKRRILMQVSWVCGLGVFMLTKKLSKLLIWETGNVNDQKECHRGFVYIFKTVHKNYL